MRLENFYGILQKPAAYEIASINVIWEMIFVTQSFRFLFVYEDFRP